MTFTDFDVPPSAFASQATVTVFVPVPGEPNTTNNKATSTSILFTLSRSRMHLSSSAAGWIAIGAAARGGRRAPRSRSCTTWRSGVCAARSSRCSADGKEDLVDFAVSLQGRIDDLHRAVDERRPPGSVASTRRVDDTVSKTAIVRYDAYENSGGHQSASVALLDAARSGVVLTRSRAGTTPGST